jgi:hypothetical protein
LNELIRQSVDMPLPALPPGPEWSGGVRRSSALKLRQAI